MVDLLDRIVASDAECERVNVNRYGREQLGSAEAEARKCPGNWYMPGGGPIRRFIQMIIPSLSAAGAGEAWPRPKPNVLAMSAEAERRSRIRMKEAASAERERWRRYVVTAPERGGDMVFIQTRQGRNGVHRNAAIHEMTREQIADARANGCGVALAKSNETIGLPAGVTTF